MKQKTALQELIDWMESGKIPRFRLREIKEVNILAYEEAEKFNNMVDAIIDKAKSLLPTEREQKIKDYNTALEGGLVRDYKSALVYLNDNYENNI